MAAAEPDPMIPKPGWPVLDSLPAFPAWRGVRVFWTAEPAARVAGVLTISAATPEDLPELVALLEDMDAFYGDATEGTLDERLTGAQAALFSSVPRAYVLLARDGVTLVGLASYSYLWPAAGISTSLYLKELYVREDARRSGAGRLLMGAVAEVAAREGCSRVEWTTDRENEGAQQFYASLGYEVNAGKVFYRACESADQPD